MFSLAELGNMLQESEMFFQKKYYPNKKIFN